MADTGLRAIATHNDQEGTMYRNHYADELSLMARLDELTKQDYRPSRQGPGDGKELVRAGRRALPRRLAALLLGLLS